MNRTHHNGDLRLENVNEHVELVGWVAKKRNFGQLVFIDLRDRSGICQLIFDESMSEALKDVRNEYVLYVSGRRRSLLVQQERVYVRYGAYGDANNVARG